mmetsp:Transcript_13990/g.30249  ORF Transcript_13990/g.30249 Transcript_13990/m.30249 type:complete len:484 (+) Transcript_13990:247-1698(+)|eukprot:CAMPEP_0202895354 /NCGR_PEP_ID=MMETSP1392-20130828/4580_1 /ASSEMBLY_ACC=CAM_ASM_000868 /TAXON_ID=225041 /ORGANISM="Chlamydomonas chlamydogama, Strain SAG 11-48b" /LENGTH=483 /DNA_ID=CAMNT_0049580341 /DNA_START=247 /DNA_END=1698 /DNA_ORIENTATION=-
MSRAMGGTDRIAKMREYEDRLNKLQQATKEEQLYATINNWQTKTDAKVKQLVVQKRFEELKARREANLDARRRRLAEKLYQEDMMLKQELVNSKETPEQRRAKLAARARELASKREAERQELAKTLYDRAFQENCDVLRETNSKRVLYRTLDERNAQIEQKMAAKIMEEEEKRMFHEMNEQERLKAEQRYLDDKRRERERRDATVKILDEQVRAVTLRREEDAAARQQEIIELRALWDKMAQEQEEADILERERMKQLAAELQEFNRIKQMEISEMDRRERELDLKILQEALAREADDEAREQAARDKRREDVRRYRQQLALMMQLEAEETAERDAMIQAVFDEQQARRDAELAAREDARRRLMAEVDAIRQEQIRYKNDQRQRELADLEQERLQMEFEAANLSATEAQARAQQRKKALMQRLEIQTQMVAKAHIKAAEEDEKLRAREIAAMAEAQYMTKVKDVVEQTDPPKWHGRRKFDWYT